MRVTSGLVFLATLMGLVCESAPRVIPGLDVVRVDGGELLAGRRVGLITNHTGRTIDGVSALDVLRDELGLTVVSLFSPEHGFRGLAAAGDHVASATVRELPVHSLYGETRAPTPAMLEGLDVLVFDIQDVGVRFYTYISTMKLAMEAAALAGIDFVVLDRPNPNGGERVEGPVLEEAFQSFVGIATIPLLHGMTVGELAALFRASMSVSGIEVNLDVVRMRGWSRDMTWSETGLVWRAPSPNIRTESSAVVYAALGPIEGINVSEGRGIEETFRRIGAPWMDGDRLLAALSDRELPGVRFESTHFVPRGLPAAPRPKYRDEQCHGVELVVVNRDRFQAVLTGLTVIDLIQDLFPEHFTWLERESVFPADLLWGTDRVRRGLDAGFTPQEILAREEPAVSHFRASRKAYLLY